MLDKNGGDAKCCVCSGHDCKIETGADMWEIDSSVLRSFEDDKRFTDLKMLISGLQPAVRIKIYKLVRKMMNDQPTYHEGYADGYDTCKDVVTHKLSDLLFGAD